MDSLKSDWDCFTQKVTSPQPYLDVAFYWMIGAALQRRVWLGSHLSPIFPNLYVLLCGGPGVGKGRVIDHNVAPLMKHHKFKPQNPRDDKLEGMIKNLQNNGAADESLVLLRQAKQAMDDIKALDKKKGIEDLLLFPQAADSTTFQSLVLQHAASNRVFHTTPCGMAPSGIYMYHSLNIIIEEASSLFNKNAEMIVDYLLKTFNCQDYSYKTKHYGEDMIPRCSLALLGGTTPDFMQRAFSSKLMGEGFAARTLFVYAAKPRYRDWRSYEHTPEQLACREKILQRLKELSQLFGQCRMSSDAEQYMDEQFCAAEQFRKNKDPRLEYYYERKALHTQKMAMCIHFSYSDSMVIEQWDIELALELLSNLEENMHFALAVKSDNPTGDLARRILKWLKESGENEPKQFADFYIRFVDYANEMQLDEALKFLVFDKKLEQDGQWYSLKQ